MKWWYVLVVLVGVVLGWWILQQFGEKRSTKVGIVKEEEIQVKTADLPNMFYTDKTGKRVETVQLVGQVVKWNPEKGLLDFDSNGKRWQVVIDLSKATMLVNSIKESTKSLSVAETSDPNWRTGFCPSDEVVVKLAGKEVVFVINNGYRTCGFRDK